MTWALTTMRITGAFPVFRSLPERNIRLIADPVCHGGSADAAYPRLLMVYGKSLAKPIVVENAPDVVKVIDHKRDGAGVNGPEDRPYLELALFWGNEWNRYMYEGKPASQLRPEDVTPFDNIPIRGRFYPICIDSPAQITLTEVNGTRTHSMWRVSPAGLKVLEDLGVPVKAECKRP